MPTTKKIACPPRWMIKADIREAIAIEDEMNESPWSEDYLMEILRQREVIGMVSPIGERIAGFMIYKLHPKKIELLRMAVGSDCLRIGVGTAMVAKLKSKLSTGRRPMLSILVSDANLAAHLFLKANGLRATSVEKNQYMFTYVETREPEVVGSVDNVTAMLTEGWA